MSKLEDCSLGDTVWDSIQIQSNSRTADNVRAFSIAARRNTSVPQKLLQHHADLVKNLTATNTALC
ncbi:MAG TPA: hypothetical protein VGK01_09400, partial [Candidatus Angelobacter sp.]